MTINASAPTAMTIWNGMMDPASAIINEYAVLSIPAFWCGVRFLSETLASLEKSVYRQKDGASQPVPHALNRLMQRKANAFATPFVVFETWHAHAIVHGNGYLAVERDERMRPIGLHNLNPQLVLPFRHNGQQWYLVRSEGGNKPQIAAAADILHLPGLGFDGMTGYPVVQLMHEALELARNGQRFASRYLRKGTQVQGSIEIPGSATKEQIDAIKDRLREHAGMDSEYAFTILTGGATLKNATIPPEQSQLLQSRQFSVIDMCRILRVPPHIVYDLSKASWANTEYMGIEVVKYSLRAWVEKAEEELSDKLLTRAEQDDGMWLGYGVESLMRGDTNTQTNTNLALLNGGVITVNEARAALDKPPHADPGANKLRTPVNSPVSGATTKQPGKSGEDKDFAKTLAPVIAAAAERVEAKTAKAFAHRAGKPAGELTIWANVFAEEQARYAADAVAPIAAVLMAAGGPSIDPEAIGQRYAQAVRGRAANAGYHTLEQLIQFALNPKGPEDHGPEEN
jgi:HK97 family phage portal protein